MLDYLTFEGWKQWRNTARTNLKFLCNEVLGYPDVQKHVHERLLSNVQWFEGGEDTCQLPPTPRALKVGQFALPPFEAIIKGYKPKVSMWDLEGSRRFLNMIPRGHLKALKHDTLIPTTGGFKKISEIEIGDKVFGLDGRPVSVIDVSPIIFREDVYEVEFSTGEKIVCDSGHLWLTDCRKDRENYKPQRNCPSAKTTEQIAGSVMIRDERNHRVPVASAVECGSIDAAIKPYTLGAWLGDGHADAARITSDDEQVIEEISLDGESVKRGSGNYLWDINGGSNWHERRKTGFVARLRSLGVLGNKHIPQAYLRASIGQRLSLLQGLMDTDGSISKSGQCTFTNKNEKLVNQVRELACSLGIKCSYVYKWDAMMKGKNCGPVYTISFYSFPNMPPFRLQRKLDRLRESRKVNLQGYRQIVAVRKAEACFVRCIAVNSEDKLFLVGDGFIPTHNSTIITQAHAIQWIINYPNVRMAISTHTDSKGKEFLSEIRNHFIKNAMFRYLFPEHCPMGKAIGNWGNQEHFDTLARTVWRREHTMSYITIGSAIAGAHFDVLLHDDLVDKENVVTKEQIERVKKHFADTFPLLETHAHPTRGNMDGWVYLTGTFYDFSDLNYSIYEHEKLKLSEVERKRIEEDPAQAEVLKAKGKVMSPRIWRLNVQSAAPNWPDGPYLWPERVGYKKLKEIEDDPAQGPALLAAQYLMNPIPPNSGLVDSVDQIKFVPRGELNGLYPHLTLHVTVDLAGMEPNAKGADNDYTVINLSGFGKAGQIFVLELYRGRFRPDEVINTLFDLHQRHPRIIDFKIEKDAHMRVLGHFLRREMGRRNTWLPIVEIQRDNRTSKVQRIKGLQPWLKNGTIRFASDLVCKQAVLDETMRFPKYVHDDILDTIADQLQNRDGGVEADVMGRPSNNPPPIGSSPMYKFKGFDEHGAEQWLNNQFGSLSRESQSDGGVDPLTGL